MPGASASMEYAHAHTRARLTFSQSLSFLADLLRATPREGKSEGAGAGAARVPAVAAAVYFGKAGEGAATGEVWLTAGDGAAAAGAERRTGMAGGPAEGARAGAGAAAGAAAATTCFLPFFPFFPVLAASASLRFMNSAEKRDTCKKGRNVRLDWDKLSSST